MRTFKIAPEFGAGLIWNDGWDSAGTLSREQSGFRNSCPTT